MWSQSLLTILQRNLVQEKVIHQSDCIILSRNYCKVFVLPWQVQQIAATLKLTTLNQNTNNHWLGRIDVMVTFESFH